MLRILTLLLAQVLILFLFACAPDDDVVEPPVKDFPHLVEAPAEEIAAVLNRLNLAQDTDSLRTALERSRIYVSRQDQSATLPLNPDTGLTEVTWAEVLAGLEALDAALVAHGDTPQALAAALARDFRWLALKPRTLLTGYYEPLLQADDKPSLDYPYPIFGRPEDLKITDLGRFREELTGKRLTYRVVEGENGPEIAPYHDRAAIDFGDALDGQGLELAWVNDRFELFSLHIQGSGRLQYPDGSVRNVLYAAQNGRPYVSLGREMADRGFMELSAVSMPRIRDYLLANPELVPELLSVNPSYVFFKLADDGPFGSIGQVLTPYASLAVDRRTIPLGAPLIVDSTLPPPAGTLITPDTVGPAFTSLLFAQDTGGAIKGTRADLFCGFGDEAYAVAGRLKNEAKVYLLLPKEVQEQ